MKSVIYIADLYEDNAHLMPWRVTLEICKNWQGEEPPELWSGQDNASGNQFYTIREVPVRRVPRIKGTLHGLAELLKKYPCDILYFPVAFCHCCKDVEKIEAQSNCRIVWYIPGGWYSLKQCFRALHYMKWKSVLPYLVQAIFPKKIFFRSLCHGRERALICFSDYTAQRVSTYYSQAAVFTILPGLTQIMDAPIDNEEKEPPYFLFFGPPSPIRGSQVLVRAFEKLTQRHPECRLHLCLRSDANADGAALAVKLKESPALNQIDVYEKSLTAAQLHQEIAGCMAVVKPFLIVPSEIPLAVIESVKYGKPVLGTGPDGTGRFIQQFGLISSHGDWRGLYENMERLLDDDTLRRKLSQKALDLAKKHPSWKDCAKVWKEAGDYQ